MMFPFAEFNFSWIALVIFLQIFFYIIINYWLMIPIYCFTDYLSLNNISKSCIPLLQWQPKPLEKKMHALVCWHGLLISIKVLKPIKNNSFNVPFSVISLPDLFIFAVVSGYILLLSHQFLTGWILLLLLILMFSFSKNRRLKIMNTLLE